MTWEYSPLLPFGTPPPLGIEDTSPKMRNLLFHKGANNAPLCKHLLKKFVYRTRIIKRRTVHSERRSWGEESDSTRTEPVST